MSALVLLAGAAGLLAVVGLLWSDMRSVRKRRCGSDASTATATAIPVWSDSGGSSGDVCS